MERTIPDIYRATHLEDFRTYHCRFWFRVGFSHRWYFFLVKLDETLCSPAGSEIHSVLQETAMEELHECHLPCLWVDSPHHRGHHRGHRYSCVPLRPLFPGH